MRSSNLFAEKEENIASICICEILAIHNTQSYFHVATESGSLLFSRGLNLLSHFFIVDQRSDFVASTFRFCSCASSHTSPLLSCRSCSASNSTCDAVDARIKAMIRSKVSSSFYVLLLCWSFPNHWKDASSGLVVCGHAHRENGSQFATTMCSVLWLLCYLSISMPLSSFSAFIRSIFRSYFGFHSSSSSRLLHIMYYLFVSFLVWC